MRKKTRTIIAFTISWELFLTKEKKEAKLYFDPSPRFGSRPETYSTRVGGGGPWDLWDEKEDWEGKTDIKGFSSVRAYIGSSRRMVSMHCSQARLNTKKVHQGVNKEEVTFVVRTNCAPKVREEIWLTDIHIKRNRRSSSSRARNGSRSSIFFLFPYRERCLRL